MQTQNRTTNALRNAFWGTAEKILSMVSRFVFRGIIIRTIGVEYVGVNSLFSSILTVLNMTELGFGAAITYMMYKPIAENDIPTLRSLLNAIRKIYRFVGLTILIGGSCAYPFMNVLVKNGSSADVNLYLIYSILLFNTVSSYFAFSYRTTLFYASQRNDILSKLALSRETVKFILQSLILIYLKNYYIYMLVDAILIIPTNCVYYFASRKCYPEIYCEGELSDQQRHEIKTKVVPLLGHRIGGTVVVSIDSMIISSVLGVYALAKYDNYYLIFHSVITYLAILTGSVTAGLGNKLYTDSEDNLYNSYKLVHFIWIMLVGWCACFLIGLYQPFILMWVGENYVYSDAYMLCIAAYFFTWQFRYIGVIMKDAAGLWEADRWKPVIGAILNLITSVAMVKITGSVLGVLFPTMAIMLFLYFPWETHVLFKQVFHRSSKDYLIQNLECVLTVLVAAFAVYISTSSIPVHGLGYFVIRFLLCAVIPPLVITAMNFKSKQFKHCLRIARSLNIKKIIS